MEYLSNHNVVKLDFLYTQITDEQLASILNQIGGNLRMLNLEFCKNLDNFEAIKNCTQLQELKLSWTNINDEQLAEILNLIGGNLRTLDLWNCYNLHNVEELKRWVRERKIKLYIQSKFKENRSLSEL